MPSTRSLSKKITLRSRGKVVPRIAKKPRIAAAQSRISAVAKPRISATRSRISAARSRISAVDKPSAAVQPRAVRRSKINHSRLQNLAKKGRLSAIQKMFGPDNALQHLKTIFTTCTTAADHGHLNVLAFFLETLGLCKVFDYQWQMLNLFYAVASTDRIAAVKWFLDSEIIKPNTGDDDECLSSAAMAPTCETLRLLLSRGFTFAQQSDALDAACEHNRLENVQFLLSDQYRHHFNLNSALTMAIDEGLQ